MPQNKRWFSSGRLEGEVLRSRKLLMLCYFYPPINDGGVERSVKFARHLPAHGWTPVVISVDAYGPAEGAGTERIVRTTELRSLYRWLFNKEFREVKRSKRSVAVLPATTPEKGFGKALVDAVRKWLMIPDVQIGWISCAFWPALSLLRGGEADAIYTTSPPESTHLLGLLLKKLTGKPWVMDLRDPWTFEPLKKLLRESSFRLSVERRLERLCFEHAGAVVINTPEAKGRYEALYPEHAARMHVITNGFDSEELARAAAALEGPFPWRDPGEGAFVLSHAGMFSRREGGDQTPHALLEALKSLLDEGIASPEGFRAIFAGRFDQQTLGRISDLGLDGLVETPGAISHFDAMRLMLRSDLLVMFDPNGAGQTYVHGKLYEYFGVGKRILGIVPDGASRELLKRSGRGSLAYPDDAKGIRQALTASLQRRDAPPRNPGFDLTRYERKRLTEKLSALLNDLVDGERSDAPE